MYPFPEPRFIVEAQMRRMGQAAEGVGVAQEWCLLLRLSLSLYVLV